MYSPSILAVGLLVSSVSARMCANFTFPVTISSRNGVFDNIATPETPLDATTFIQNSTRQGGNFTEMALTGYATVSGTYNIAATYCMPDSSNMSSSMNKPSTLQVLTHGIGFDRSYWDLPYDNYNYSYVDTALKSGYCTFSYDRLGIGMSSHGEPKNEIQAFLEIQALAKLTNMLRAGTMPNVSKKFDKIVHVGHSFGSTQTYALSNMYPTISDGIILTGFSLNGSFVGLFSSGGDFQQANLNQPLRFGSNETVMALNTLIQNYAFTDYVAPLDITTVKPMNYPNGYLVNSNVNANQYLFFYPGYFDTGILYFAEQTKQPVTIGELLSLGSVPMMNKFKGPVLVVTGSNDLPYCGGDCFATGGAMASVPASIGKAIPGAKNFEAYIQPNTGHGINFHYNATGAYQKIQSYLGSNGL